MKFFTSEALLPSQHPDRATNIKQETISDYWKRDLYLERNIALREDSPSETQLSLQL